MVITLKIGCFSISLSSPLEFYFVLLFGIHFSVASSFLIHCFYFYVFVFLCSLATFLGRGELASYKKRTGKPTGALTSGYESCMFWWCCSCGLHLSFRCGQFNFCGRAGRSG